MRFELALEEVLKRHQPIDWAQAASSRIGLVRHTAPLVWTDFELLHTIEANCAYARGQRNDPVTELRLRQAINVFREDDSPYEEYLLKELGDLHMFMQVTARRQLEVQSDAHDLRNTLGRYQLLVAHADRFVKSRDILESRYDLTVDAWAALCIGAAGQGMSHPLRRVTIAGYPRAMPKLFTDAGIRSFVSFSARTPAQIRAQYRSERESLRSPHMHVCLRTGFLERPLIDFDKGRCVAPQPNLLIRHLIGGLEDLIAAASEETWTDELGDALQCYVGTLLEGTFDHKRVFQPDRKWRAPDRKRCDFLVDLADCHLLIECKATRFSQRLLVKEHLRRDSSSNRIREATTQLIDTAHDLHGGNFIGLTARHQKPAIGFIVTLGDLFAPNSDWYWQNVIDVTNGRVVPTEQPFYSPLMCKPQIISITGFELLIAVLREGKKSVSALVQDQLEKAKDLRHGDWPRALPNHLADDKRGIPKELQDAWEDYDSRIRSMLPHD